MVLTDTYELANGVKIPVIGFGMWQNTDGQEAYNSVISALKAGYRHIDTAEHYGNEQYVGQAIKDFGIKRDELFVTTKLWNNAHDYQLAKDQFEESLKRLQLDYVDLYLIHWPNPIDLREGKWQEGNAQAWRAMEELYKQGKIRAIGVSNFRQTHIQELEKTQTIAPMVNQILLNPAEQNKELVKYNKEKNILNEAYSPLGTGKLIQLPQVKEIAEHYQKSVPQLLIRWSLQQGFLPLPKSTHEQYIQSNAEVFDFEINKEDLIELAKLDQQFSEMLHGDPDKVTF